MGEKVGKSRNLGLSLTPANLFKGAPKMLKPVLGTLLRGLLLGKVWTMPRPQGSEKNLFPQMFGGCVPIGVHKLDIMTHYHIAALRSLFFLKFS